MMPTSAQLDFSDLSMIDDHCHLFNIESVPHELPRVLSMSLNDMPTEQLQYTLVYRRMLKELRALLEMPAASDHEVLAVREQRMTNDYPAWIADLWADAVIETLIIDLGYKPAEVDLPTFEKLVPAQVYYMFRIESVLDDLWKQIQAQTIDMKETEDRFFQALSAALDTPNMVAVKSIIGYRTGLAVQMVDRARIMASDPSEKTFRDYFLLETLEWVTQRGLPMQIHAAFGESNINVLNNNPFLLKALLDHPRYQHSRIVLVHGGYPYCFEAGYLASVYPNVYIDISEMLPFVPIGASQGLRQIFDMCPFNKVLYGSDGFVLPEIHWLGAKMAKEALASLFSRYIELGLFDHDLAFHVAGMVFSETARGLYELEPLGTSQK
jgi:predicted TIM-barrel fold metal-dependent hydrolase